MDSNEDTDEDTDMKVNHDVEEDDPLAGGSQKRSRQENDDKEDENTIKRFKRELEEFGYSDLDSFLDSDEDADKEVNHYVEEDDLLAGGSQKRSRQEDDDEEDENIIKRVKREMEEFEYSDLDSCCSSSDSDVSAEDTDDDADMKVNRHVPVRDVNGEDERSAKCLRQWIADSKSDRDLMPFEHQEHAVTSGRWCRGCSDKNITKN